MKRQVGQPQGHDDLIGDAACYRPGAGDRSEEGNDRGEKKSDVDKEALVQAQERRQRKQEQQHCER